MEEGLFLVFYCLKILVEMWHGIEPKENAESKFVLSPKVYPPVFIILPSFVNPPTPILNPLISVYLFSTTFSLHLAPSTICTHVKHRCIVEHILVLETNVKANVEPMSISLEHSVQDSPKHNIKLVQQSCHTVQI